MRQVFLRILEAPVKLDAEKAGGGEKKKEKGIRVHVEVLVSKNNGVGLFTGRAASGGRIC